METIVILGYVLAVVYLVIAITYLLDKFKPEKCSICKQKIVGGDYGEDKPVCFNCSIPMTAYFVIKSVINGNRIKIKPRIDTPDNWLKCNPILLKGEMGIEIGTMKLKNGDGLLVWNLLPYQAKVETNSDGLITNLLPIKD